MQHSTYQVYKRNVQSLIGISRRDERGYFLVNYLSGEQEAMAITVFDSFTVANLTF